MDGYSNLQAFEQQKKPSRLKYWSSYNRLKDSYSNSYDNLTVAGSNPVTSPAGVVQSGRTQGAQVNPESCHTIQESLPQGLDTPRLGSWFKSMVDSAL